MPPADTPPNAAFVDDPGVVSDKRLDSLHFPVSGTAAQLIFEHNFNLEASDVDPNVGFDGGVLEISFDGGNTFQDILAVGGSFVMGGYNRTISTDRGSPIAGRQAWSGNSEGFIIYDSQLAVPSRQAAGSAGEWPATTVAPAKAGALTRCYHVGAHRFRVIHRLLNLARRRHHAPAVRPAKPSRYTRVYSGTSPKPVTAVRSAQHDGRSRVQRETPYNNSLTSDFSSFSSATDASIFARLKSFIGTPCTISHFPPRTRTGNDEINPFSTP